MLDDGTLQLSLRATGSGGIVGHAFDVYPPDHEKYREILAHVGPLQPGESTLVRPWPRRSDHIRASRRP